MLRLLVFHLSLVILFADGGGGAPVRQGQDTCIPSYRDLSDTPILSRAASWRIYQMVALVGCEKDLETITEEERLLLIQEFEGPVVWSTLDVVVDRELVETRAQVAARMNELLGRDVVTDVVLHDTKVFGHH